MSGDAGRDGADVRDDALSESRVGMTAEPSAAQALSAEARAGVGAGVRAEPGERVSAEPGAEPALAAPPSMLESRYRTLLRLLPRGYREVREDEMADTFLAGMRDADPENFDLTLRHGRPDGAEARAVMALALRARWGETVAPERFAVRRAGLRTAVLMVLTALWTVAVAELCWLAWALAFQTVSDGIDLWTSTFGLPVGSWQWFQQWPQLAWLPTLPLVVLGGRVGARWAAACVAVPLLASAANAVRNILDAGPVWPGYLTPVLIDVAVIGGLLALGAARQEDMVRRPVRYLVAAGAAVLALNILPALYSLGALPEPAGDAPYPVWGYIAAVLFTDHAALWCWAALAAALWVVARRPRHGGVPTADLLALSVFAGVAALSRFLASVGALPQLGDVLGRVWTAAVVTQFLLAAAICVVSGILAARRLHRLPPPAYLPCLR